ncbi:MAG: ATP synthase F1 subunit gamma [Planctomycetales bacterium]|nr:ATP synthase F1 subunit gamma [Planctomycetales bacterium]NIM09779.1 ATP synthase F1 subunit gamma [Planctomycetales bacterium]NIN09248.1 ATP synthase F1 subunit gamma [Planctomycetales bacterium]NIN78348.1 ATP synthase F1 subunit gamma [Planctomycetales bacterium]NIO35527.1 ATP synthase F1 subunit gamma [Planctomycetales bacterium]
MANPRALDKRRKSVRNIRKITRTMELIATARFKQAMDRAHAATAYTDRMKKLLHDLTRTGLEVTHPLLEPRETTHRGILLVLSSNRGLCGGYNGNLLRRAQARWEDFGQSVPQRELEVSGKRGLSFFKHRQQPVQEAFTHFEDKPRFDEVEVLANRYLNDYATGQLDRLDIAYTKFRSSARQEATVETLLPLGSMEEGLPEVDDQTAPAGRAESQYEFLPSAAQILEEVIPTSFKIRLFKCFLDAAVSEQIARMVAMKSATENADDLIRSLSRTYNRARQAQITGELLEVMGGVEALKE